MSFKHQNKNWNHDFTSRAVFIITNSKFRLGQRFSELLACSDFVNYQIMYSDISFYIDGSYT